MLATQYPGKLRVGDSPAQWQGSTQAENFQALHLLEPQASTEVQHPSLRDSICIPWNDQQQVKNKFDSYFYSFGQDSRYFGTPVYETSEKQSVYFDRHCMKAFSPNESYMNIDTGQQRQNLDFTADCLVVTAKTTPSKHLCCCVLNNNPLLTALLKETSPKTDFSRERHFEGLKVMALDPADMRTQRLDYSGAMNFAPGQQQSSPPLYARSSPEKFSLVGKVAPPTDEQIKNFVSEKIKNFRNKNKNGGHTCSNTGGNDCRPNNSTGNFLGASTSDTHWKVGQELEEDDSNAASTPKTKETEYPQVTGKAAANCVRTGDEGLAALPSIVSDGLKYPTSSQERHKSREDGINKTLAFKHMPDVPGLRTKSSSRFSEEQKFLKDPQYDDISECEDITQHPLSLMQVEDISEDEIPQMGNIAGGPELFGNLKYGSVSCGPSALKDHDETDDDDDWMVIPLNVSDIKFEPEDQEPEDEDGERPDEVVVIDDSDDDESGDKEPQLDAPANVHREPNPSAPPPSSQIEVFDTCESFLQAQRTIFNMPAFTLDYHTSGSQKKDDALTHGGSTSGSESEETEDSRDYSSDTSHNHLTVSTKLLKSSSAMNDCSEKDDDEAASEMVQHTTNSLKVSEEADVIIIESDTEDESDQICHKNTGFYSDSGNSKDGQRSQPRKHPSDLPAARHRSDLHAAQSGQSSQKISEDTEIIISDSEMEDISDKNCSRTPLSSGSVDDGDPPQKMHSAEKVDHKHGCAEKQPRKSRSSVNTTAKRVRKSEQGRKPSRSLLSGSEDSEDETVNGLCETAAQRKPTKQRPPSEDSPKNKARSVDEDAECRTGPLIPVLHVVEYTKPPHLKLRDCRVHLQANLRTSSPGTLNGTTKKNDSGGKDTKRLTKPKPADRKQNLSKKEMQGRSKKSSPVRRQHSLPNPERPSTSTNTRSNVNGRFSEAGPRLLSSRGRSQSKDPAAAVHPPESMRHASVPRRQAPSSRRQLNQSHRSSSTSDHHYAPTNGLSALEKVTKDWQDGYTPIPPPRRFRNRTLRSEEHSRNTNEDWCTDARPRRRRHKQTPRSGNNPQESETPLMKRSKNDAKRWTSAIHRDPARKESSSVGQGYKWSEKRKERSRRKVLPYGRRQREESVLDHDL